MFRTFEFLSAKLHGVGKKLLSGTPDAENGTWFGLMVLEDSLVGLEIGVDLVVGGEVVLGVDRDRPSWILEWK